MKIPASSRQRGFTLVELLVVISIIAVLAAAGFAAGNAAIQKAKKTTALASATAIETAVNNFFTEYGTMPSTTFHYRCDRPNEPDQRDRVVQDPARNGNGNYRGEHALIKFLSVKEGKADKNGLMYNKTGTEITGLYDPWGGGYGVILDLDFDEKVEPQPTGGSKATLNSRQRRGMERRCRLDHQENRRRREDLVIHPFP